MTNAQADRIRLAYESHKRGEIAAATHVYREVLADHPDHPAALRYLGLALFQTGEREQAMRLVNQSASLAAEAAVYSDLGRMHAILKEPQQAIDCFRKAVVIDPEYADGWHNLGTALRLSGDTHGALDAYKRTLAIDPERGDTYLNLGNLLVDDNQVENAIESFKRAAALDPKLAQVRSSLANELSGRGDVSEAERIFRQALVLDPKHAQAWFGLGRTLEDLGNAPEAAQCYRQVLALHAGQAWAMGQLLGLEGEKIDANLLAQAQHTLEAEKTPDGARALIGYGLGKVFDRRGEYDAAFGAFKTANNARRQSAGEFDAVEFEQRIDRIIDTFSAEFFAQRSRSGIDTDLPVFIIGMPRSGTTLTEQILDSHPHLFGAGELAYLAELATGLTDRFNLDAAWPMCITQLTDAHIHESAHVYLEKSTAKAPPFTWRVSDKSPLNFFHLGLVGLLFPNAHIVHCRRNPIDTCLSIYFENFRTNQTYATDLSSLATYYRGYQRLMAHWRHVLTVPILEFDYEASVNDVEAQARVLIEFLGARWDERCLEFHQSRRAVQTPSRWQVRKPIYRTSLARWRHYETYLNPLKDIFPEAVSNMD